MSPRRVFSSCVAITLLAGLAAPAAAQLSTAGPMPPGPPPLGTPPLAGTAPCTVIDDGTTENSLGLTQGGWLCHMQYIDCLAEITELQSAYASAMFPGGIVNGRPVKIAIWEDASADTDPTTDLTLLFTMNTVVANGSTDILNAYPVSPSVLVSSSQAWIGAAVAHSAGEFPAPMDVDNPTPRSWVFGTNQPTTINLMNINANNVAPTSMDSLGFPAAFLLRADGNATPAEPGTAYCFCDPTSSFPSGVCANPGTLGNGCANSAHPEGAHLGATGTTNPDTVQFVATNCIPNQPGLFFQGLNATGGGNGSPFGDGLRCAGGGVVRLQIRFPDAAGTAMSTVSISATGGVTPGSGEVRRYQFWYRNPTNSPCGNQFNLTNGYEITW